MRRTRSIATSNAFALFALAGVLLQCSNPAPPEQKQRTPRDYAWTIDTLQAQGSVQTLLTDIWGANSHDVYAVGHDAVGPAIWHYDGGSWTQVDVHTLGGVDLFDITGFGSNDVWVVGARIIANPAPPPNFVDSSLIVHFDGHVWTVVPAPIGLSRQLLSIGGSSATDIWAGGDDSLLIHYDGASWRTVGNPRIGRIVSVVGSTPTDGHALAVAGDTVGLYTIYMSRWNGVSWSLEDSAKEGAMTRLAFGANSLNVIEQSSYSVGQGVFRYVAGLWQHMYSETGTSFLSVSGSSPSSVIAVGTQRTIVHYGGVDWRRLMPNDNGITCVDVWVSSDRAFILSIDASRTYVVQGK